MKRSAAVLAAVLAGTVPLGTVPLAYAAFATSASAASSFSTASLAAPTGVGVQRTCRLGALGAVLGADYAVTWTPSTTSWASSQRVELRSGAVLLDAEDLGPAATSTTLAVTSLAVGSYTVTVRSAYATWTATSAPVSTAGC